MWTSHDIQGAPATGRFIRITLLAWPSGARPGVGEISATGTIASP